MATRLTDVRDFPRSGLDLDDDKSLVLAFQSGDIDAYSDIYVKYRALSAQICYRILQDREEADEAVQETMLRVYRGLGTFNGRYQLQAWVARIATNVSLDMVRARSRRPQRDPVTPDISENARLVVALTDDPSEAVERVLDQEEIRSILSEIPDHHREALVLREFEGRSHEEIGEALGVSPQQAKALIHRAKKSFRRAWDRSGERRGVAALAPIIFLAPFRMPGFLRKLWQPAHDVVASATATAQQAAVQVTAAPAVTQGAVSMADKVTAAAITVIVAGTVSVGAVHPAHAEAVEAHAGDRVAGAGSRGAGGRHRRAARCGRSRSSSPTTRRTTSRPTRRRARARPGPSFPSRPRPTHRPRPTPAPRPGPATPPPPPPPAPAWTGAFTASGGLAATSLSQISQHVTGQHSDQLLFGEVMQGALVDKHGDTVGTVYLDFGGSIAGGSGSMSSLWLWIDTPEGQYKYAAAGNLRAATQADDGSTTYVFEGGFSLSSVPATLDTAGPARRDHLHLARVLGRRVALRDQRLHGRILSQNTPTHEQP